MTEKSNIIWYEMSDSAILRILGIFVKETRLIRNKTQEEIAINAGIKRTTLIRIEKGIGGNMNTFVRILRCLEQLIILQSFIAPTQISPLKLAKLEQNKRMRAGKKKGKLKAKKNSKPPEW